MRSILFRAAGVGIGVLCLTVSDVRAQQQMHLVASVVDDTGAPVATFQPSDLQLFEDGAEAKVVKIEAIERPVRVQVLIDNGIGLGGLNLGHLRNGVRGLIEALPPGVEVTIVSTAPQPRFLVRATTDRAAMLKGLDLLSSDGGAGKFVDALREASERIDKDKRDSSPVVIMSATTSGDRTFLERDVNEAMRRLQERSAVVHIVLFTGSSSQSGGVTQTNIGLAVTKLTGGRFETINEASRLAMLLPELGAQTAKLHEGRGRQFRITVARPPAATGAVGKLSVSARAGLALTGATLEDTVH